MVHPGNEATRTIVYPDRAWDDGGPNVRNRMSFGSNFSLSSSTYKVSAVVSRNDDGGWYFPHARECPP